MTPRPAPSTPAVDPQNPWLGLATFNEETRAYFHGRDEEVAPPVASERSATYSPCASMAWVSSIEFGTACLLMI